MVRTKIGVTSKNPICSLEKVGIYMNPSLIIDLLLIKDISHVEISSWIYGVGYMESFELFGKIHNQWIELGMYHTNLDSYNQSIIPVDSQVRYLKIVPKTYHSHGIPSSFLLQIIHKREKLKPKHWKRKNKYSNRVDDVDFYLRTGYNSN